MMDTLCDSKSGETKCAPGIKNYLCFTYDIVKGSRTQHRACDFDNVDTLTTLHGSQYYVPKSSNVRVAQIDKESSTTDYRNTAWSSTEELSFAMYTALDIIPSKTRFTGTLRDVLAQVTGVSAEAYVNIQNTISMNLYYMSRYVSIEKVEYDIRQTDNVCSPQFYSRYVELTEDYQEELYMAFIRDFGTHIIVGITEGGTLELSQSVEQCAISDYMNVGAAFEAYVTQASLLLEGDYESTEIFDQTISRSSRKLNGGDSAAFSVSYADWVASIYTAQNAASATPIHYKLEPISVIAGNNMFVRENLDRATISYAEMLTVVNISIDACDNPCNACGPHPPPSSANRNSGISVGVSTAMCILLVYYLCVM